MLLLGAAVAVLVAGPALALAAPSVATVEFGNPNAPSTAQNCFTGSATQPPEPCANAFHKLIPQTALISAPGTVNYELNGFHQVSVYSPGKKPQDIRVMGADVGRVNDPNGRIFNSAPGANVTVPVNFTQPGKYLVICNLLSHWEQGMWGWAEVQ
jgi:uncharacterized cupredoxin-like copper-binding protein